MLGGGGDFDFVEEYPALPDCEELELEDEFNEETFGADLPSEDWELQDLAAQTEQISSSSKVVAPSGVQLPSHHQLDPWGHHQAWLEESISHILDDDDEMGPPKGIGSAPPSHAVPIPSAMMMKQKPQAAGRDLTDIFGMGSPQTPFFDMTVASTAIWGPPVNQEAQKPVTVCSISTSHVADTNRKLQQQGPGQVVPQAVVNGGQKQHHLMTLSTQKDRGMSETESLDIEFGSFTDVSENSGEQVGEESSGTSGGIPLKQLLQQMHVQKQQHSKMAGGTPIKGAKTLEEIEAELIQPKVMSLEELERQIIGRKDQVNHPVTQKQTVDQARKDHHQIIMQQHLLKLQRDAAIALANQRSLAPTTAANQQPSRISPNSFLAAVTTAASMTSGQQRSGSPSFSGVQGTSTVPPPVSTGPPPGLVPQFPPGFDPRMIPRFPPGHPMAGMPMLPPHMMPPGMQSGQGGTGISTAQPPPSGQMPPIPPALLMNPQFRAALAAHLAAGKPLPPGINLSMLFPSPLLPQRMPPPPPGLGGIAPRVSADPRTHVGTSHPPPPPPFGLNRMQNPHDLINQQQQQSASGMGYVQMNSGGKMMQQRNRSFECGNGMMGGVRGGRDTRDPFNGLMGRRERDWLVKISSMQLQSDNPYQDDYYFTMLKNRQLAKETEAGIQDLDKEQLTHKDSGETPYVYVPPKFEGSLGKVQYLSANFPRQLIDLTKSDSLEDNTEHSSPRGTPVSANLTSDSLDSSGSEALVGKKVLGSTALRQFKVLLMEVENLWNLLLDCEDHHRLLLEAPDEAKTGIQFAVKVRIAQIAERLAGERLPLIACIRKGKHVIARSFGLLDKEQAVSVLQGMCKHMSQIVRKDMNEEALDVMFPAISQCIIRLGKQHLTSVIDSLSPSALKRAFASKNKFVYSFMLLLMCQCSRKKVQMTAGKENVKSLIADWTNSVIQTPIDVFPTPDWTKGDQVTGLRQWLNKEIGVSEDVCEKLAERLSTTQIVD